MVIHELPQLSEIVIVMTLNGKQEKGLAHGNMTISTSGGAPENSGGSGRAALGRAVLTTALIFEFAIRSPRAYAALGPASCSSAALKVGTALLLCVRASLYFVVDRFFITPISLAGMLLPDVKSVHLATHPTMVFEIAVRSQS